MLKSVVIYLSETKIGPQKCCFQLQSHSLKHNRSLRDKKEWQKQGHGKNQIFISNFESLKSFNFYLAIFVVFLSEAGITSKNGESKFRDMLLFCCFVGLFSLKNGNNSYFIVEQGAYSRKVLLFGNSHRNNLKLASVLMHLGVQSSKSK